MDIFKNFIWKFRISQNKFRSTSDWIKFKIQLFVYRVVFQFKLKKYEGKFNMEIRLMKGN